MHIVKRDFRLASKMSVRKTSLIYCGFFLTLLAACNLLAVIEAYADDTPPAITFEVDGDRFIIDQKDIVKAVAEFDENSHVIFCLTASKLREFNEIAKRIAGQKVDFEIAGEISGRYSLNSFTGNCLVLGPFRKLIADRIAGFFRGETASIALDEFNPVKSNQYCPEKLFIEICLDTRADFEAIRELAEKRGLEESYFYEDARKRSVDLRIDDLTRILVVETRVVDLLSSSCSVFDVSPQEKEPKSVCAVNFPLVQEAMPDTGKRIEYIAPSYNGSRREYSQQWIFEEKNNRSLVSATTDELGHKARFRNDKLVLPVRK